METLYVRNLDEKVGVETLKEGLRALFGQFGSIIDIVARKTLKTKGQAFIVFDEKSQADAAQEATNGTEFRGRILDVSFARSKSDATVEKQNGPDAVEERRKSRKEKKMQQLLKRTADDSTGQPSFKKPKLVGEPHKILFLKDLPSSTNLDALNSIYQNVSGFVEARLFAARGVGFVEFLTIEDATRALSIPAVIENVLVSVTYAKQ